MVTFRACRSNPEVVEPARATPREVKSLSDVDNHPNLRPYTTMVEFFRRRVPGVPEPPAASSIVKAALAEALVYYYPIAGRLRELPAARNKHKLVVDCTAEGVVFVEAQADVRLEEFGDPLVPPYPCVNELLCDVGDVSVVVGKPLLYLQMTEFKCGGLALALTMCHKVVDAFGMLQLFKCIMDLARGETLPTVLPTWERHLLISSSETTSDSTSMPSLAKNNDAKPPKNASTMPPEGMLIRSFLFGQREIAALRSRVPEFLGRSATVFELITAVVWRCRTAALEYAPHEQVGVMFLSNARGSWKRNPPLPSGFYGNAQFIAVAKAAAGELCHGPLADAVELVHEAKIRVTEEHAQSALGLIARGEYNLVVDPRKFLLVSDITRCGDDSLDLGWAERVGGGVPMGARDGGISMMSFYMTAKDTNGDKYVVVPMVLPEPVMGRFVSQLAAVTKELPRS